MSGAVAWKLPLDDEWDAHLNRRKTDRHISSEFRERDGITFLYEFSATKWDRRAKLTPIPLWLTKLFALGVVLSIVGLALVFVSFMLVEAWFSFVAGVLVTTGLIVIFYSLIRGQSFRGVN